MASVHDCPLSAEQPYLNEMVTGRATRAQRSEYNRPETIEETADLVNQAGDMVPVQVDHLDSAQVQALVMRIETEQGRLDILVNDI